MLLPNVSIRGTKFGEIHTIYSTKQWEPIILEGVVLDDLR